jgi:hypothetical protein
MNRIKFGALIVVAFVGAAVSYFHIRYIAVVFRQPWQFADVLPLAIDGMMVACSFHIYQSGKTQAAGVGIARVGLWIGALASLSANFGFGVRTNYQYGLWSMLIGALLAGVPSLAFVITAEVLIISARRTTRAGKRATVTEAVEPAATATKPGSEPADEPVPAATRLRRGAEPAGFGDAVEAYRASLADGKPLSERQLAADYLATDRSPNGNRHAASRAIDLVNATMNGHAA